MSRLVHFDLAQIKRDFSLSAFIETGCDQGDGLATAEQLGFSPLYSCDIQSESVRICRKKFPQAKIKNGDSLSCLEGFCKEVWERTFFWLDAHFPYGPLEPEEKIRFPLRLELKLIAEYKNFSGDVIAFDDLRCICAEDNPLRLAEELEPYAVRGWTIVGMVAPFLDTHWLEILDIQEGIGILRPKVL